MIKKLFGIALFTFVIGACSSVEDSLLETPVDPIEEPGLIAYPRKNNLGNMTRNESMASDWENWKTVILASGVSVARRLVHQIFRRKFVKTLKLRMVGI